MKNSVATQLESLLSEECKQHEAHALLIAEERALTTNFKSEAVKEISAKREEIIEKIRTTLAQRSALVEQLFYLGSYRGKLEESEVRTLRALKLQRPLPKLSEFVRNHFTASEQARLIPIVERLRAAVTASRQQTLQHNQITGFALTMVNGLLSKVFAASHNVLNTYGKAGQKLQRFNPALSRHQDVIEKA